MKIQTTSRRRFLRILASGAVAVPSGAMMLNWNALHAQTTPESTARSAPQLPEDDPAAFALGYVHDADDVDLSKYPRYEPGQICANCQQWRADPDVEWAPCAIFPGNSVRNEGWCSVWVRKVG